MSMFMMVWDFDSHHRCEATTARGTRCALPARLQHREGPCTGHWACPKHSIPRRGWWCPA